MLGVNQQARDQFVKLTISFRDDVFFFRLDSAVRKRMRVSRDFSAVIRAAIVHWHFYFIVCLRKSMKRPTGSAGRRGRRLQLGFNSLGLLCLRLSLKEFCTFQLADEGSKSVIELKRCTAANCYYMHCAQFSRNQRKIITQNLPVALQLWRFVYGRVNSIADWMAFGWSAVWQ